MKTRLYWNIRKRILNLIFIIKKTIYKVSTRRHSSKEYSSFLKFLLEKFVYRIIKAIVLFGILEFGDSILYKHGITKNISSEILINVIIGQLGVAGVILGLYSSNISNIYSTRYASAPKKIAIAFQYDGLTVRGLNFITNFIIYGTIILSRLLLGYKVGLLPGSLLIVWAILVVISLGITGNRIYQLSDVFRVADDAYVILNRVVSKQLKQEIYISDANYQNHFMKITSDKIELLKSIQKYGCNPELVNSSSVLEFMCSNLALMEQYWLIKNELIKDSFWFKRKGVYQQWHFINYEEALTALSSKTALRRKEKPDNYWLEDELMSINHNCINYLIKKNDFGTLYNYFDTLRSVCKSAIANREANYYIKEIDWLKTTIQNSVNNINSDDNLIFAGLVELISLLYLDIIVESSKYFKNFNIDEVFKSVIKGIDTGKAYDSISAIRGRENIEIYKKILTEVQVEGHRLTPDWLMKQFITNEEFIYVNSLFDVVRESIDHAYSLGEFFVDNQMYYEACILFTRFYEYESKLSYFYICSSDIEKSLKKYHKDNEDKWDDSRLELVKEKFLYYKKEIPDKLVKCSSNFAIKNWDRREEYPDFLGESYNHIAENTVESIINNDIEQFEKTYSNLTRMILLYQEYIRSDFIKNKDLYRIEHAFYAFTSPIVEWAQIGGLGILWGEFFKDKQWSSIVKGASKIIFNIEKSEEEAKSLASQMIEFASQREKFIFSIGNRGILKTSWNLSVQNAIMEANVIETEYVKFGSRIKTDSKLIKAFCPNFLSIGFSSDPSEVFWVICVNPLLSEKEKFHSKYSWEYHINQ